MSRKKKKEEFIDFQTQQLSPAAPHIWAVFHDPEDSKWVVLPVINFALGVATFTKSGKIVDQYVTQRGL